MGCPLFSLLLKFASRANRRAVFRGRHRERGRCVNGRILHIPQISGWEGGSVTCRPLALRIPVGFPKYGRFPRGYCTGKIIGAPMGCVMLTGAIFLEIRCFLDTAPMEQMCAVWGQCSGGCDVGRSITSRASGVRRFMQNFPHTGAPLRGAVAPSW